MTQSLDIPPLALTLSGRVGALNCFDASLHLWIEPTDRDAMTSMREWTMPAANVSIMAGAHDNSLHGLTLPIADAGEPTTTMEAVASELVEHAEFTVALTDAVRHLRRPRDAYVTDHEVRFGEREPVRWIRIEGDAQLAFGIDADGALAVIVACTEVPVPKTFPVHITVEGNGSSTAYGTRRVAIGTDAKFDPDAMTSEELQAHFTPLHPDEAPVDEWVHIQGRDAQDSIALSGGDRLRHLEVAAEPGVVIVPDDAEDAAEFVGTITWPAPDARASVDVIDERSARFHVRMGDGAASAWVRLAPGFLIGHDELHVREIVILDAEHVAQPDWMFGAEVDPVEMHAQHALEAANQFTIELERTATFVAEPDFGVYGPKAAPNGLEPLIETRTSSWGGERVQVVVLRWMDHLAMFDPERAADAHRAPRLEIEVSYEPRIDHPGPDFPEDGYWLVTASSDVDFDPTMTPAEGERLQQEQEMRARALQRSWKQERMSIDGDEIDVDVIRTAGCFIARGERDGARITVKSAHLGDALPDLVPVRDLAPALAQYEAFHARMRELMQQPMAPTDGMPPAVALAFEAANGHLQALSMASQSWPGQPRPILTPLFADAIVEAAGGADAFEARAGVVFGAVTNVSGYPAAIDRDGKVVHAVITAFLPEPNGGVVAHAMALTDGMHDHDEVDVRAAAARQLDRNDMARYSLQVNALIARQLDGSYMFETDVVGLIVDLAGGFDALLAPPGPPATFL